MAEQTDVNAVNAWKDDAGVPRVVVALRGEDGEWREFRLSCKDADTLRDMVHLALPRT